MENNELTPINLDYEQQIKDVIAKYGQHWRRALESKGKDKYRSVDRTHLIKYVFDRTHFLDNIITDFKTRVICCLRHVTEVPLCQNPKCRKPLPKYIIDNVIEEHPRETMFCCHECVYEAKEKEEEDTSIHFYRDYPTDADKIEFFRQLLEKQHVGYQKTLSGKDYDEPREWLYNAIPKLQDPIYANSTRIYWLLHGLTDFPTCARKGCNNKFGIGENVKTTVGYGPFCSRGCAARADSTQQRFQETSQKKYGKDNPSQADSVKQKIKDTTFEHCGYTSYLQTPECREAGRRVLNEKKKKNDIRRQKEKEEREKLKREKLVGSSITEDQIFIWLKYAFQDDMVQHYRSEKYPFYCDFYIKSLDLYIEYQGTWTHGEHPYDDSDENDRKKLDYMRTCQSESKYYRNAIYVWTELDVKKRNTAKENGLNYLEWWSVNDAATWISKNSSISVPFEMLIKHKMKKGTFNLNTIRENLKTEDQRNDEALSAYKFFLNTPFPYYEISDKKIATEIQQLKSEYAYSDKLPSPIIMKYCRSIWKCESHGTRSPLAYWEYLKTNYEAFKKLYDNRMRYRGIVTPMNLRDGMNISKVASKVSYFKPLLAKRLINAYLADATEVFNPFNGFSGIMLGSTIGCGKTYVGQDINSEFVEEANAMISDLNLPATVKVQDIFTDDECQHDVLFCCPPYENIEKWNFDENGTCVDKCLSCDEWIDVCLSKYKCRKYLFVVDNRIEKWKSNIVEEIVNHSHFGKNTEYVVLIKQ